MQWREGRYGPLENRIARILRDTVEALQVERRWRLDAPARAAAEAKRREEEHARENPSAA